MIDRDSQFLEAVFLSHFIWESYILICFDKQEK